MSAAPAPPSTRRRVDRHVLRRIDPRVVRRASVSALVVVALLVGAYFVPLPSVGRVREWGEQLGPWFPWVFFLAYAVITIGPIPRTTFTVMSGVFFGPVVGFTGAMIASTAAALGAFVLVRSLGRERVQPYLKKPVV